MNGCNAKFLEDNNIDFNNLDDRIYTPNDINSIVHKYEVHGKCYNGFVSMENLVGVYDHYELNFPDILDDFFDTVGSSYRSRSVSMLDYDSSNIIDGLEYSFSREPIRTLLVDDNKQVVLTNGMHRFLVLRSLYLSEKSKCTTDKELSDLEDKFTIPVEIVQNNMTKTYCKYLIDVFQDADSIMDTYIKSVVEGFSDEGDKNYSIVLSNGHNEKKLNLSGYEYMEYADNIVSISPEFVDWVNTGNSVVEYFDGRKISVNDDELIEITRNVIANSKVNLDETKYDEDDFLYNPRNYEVNDPKKLGWFMEEYDSLREFVTTNFKEELKIGEKYEDRVK